MYYLMILIRSYYQVSFLWLVYKSNWKKKIWFCPKFSDLYTSIYGKHFLWSRRSTPPPSHHGWICLYFYFHWKIGSLAGIWTSDLPSTKPMCYQLSYPDLDSSCFSDKHTIHSRYYLQYWPRHRGLGEECTTFCILSVKGARSIPAANSKPAIALRSKREEKEFGNETGTPARERPLTRARARFGLESILSS